MRLQRHGVLVGKRKIPTIYDLILEHLYLFVKHFRFECTNRSVNVSGEVQYTLEYVAYLFLYLISADTAIGYLQ
jgi:hypothetical protein